jgi:hypothetical protein
MVLRLRVTLPVPPAALPTQNKHCNGLVWSTKPLAGKALERRGAAVGDQQGLVNSSLNVVEYLSSNADSCHEYVASSCSPTAGRHT